MALAEWPECLVRFFVECQNFEESCMRVIEVLGRSKIPEDVRPNPIRSGSDVRTEFEKNATKLRGKERRLNPQKPIKPVQHGP